MRTLRSHSVTNIAIQFSRTRALLTHFVPCYSGDAGADLSPLNQNVLDNDMVHWQSIYLPFFHFESGMSVIIMNDIVLIHSNVIMYLPFL